jgi:hypothetical protein
MTPTPPHGSRISIRSDDGDSVIVIPPSAGSFWRYGIGLFILFWLGGWFYGFRSAAAQLLSGSGPVPAKGFLVFWLGAWTLGGILAAYSVFRIFRPPVPESLRLRRNSFVYDSGIPPVAFQAYFRYRNQIEYWRSLFPKRTIVEIDRAQLATLRLRDTDAGNRLTVDAGASRIDLAAQGSEIEREWLYELLAERYSIPAPAMRSV